MPEQKRFKKWIPFAAILLVYLLMEGTGFIGLYLLKGRYGEFQPVALTDFQRTALKKFIDRGHGELTAQDPELGWVDKSEANSAGMRDSREYEKVPSPGIVRISAFGDSFTYGSDVKIQESWIRQLAALEPSMEVLNYGSGAYGLDQAYLRYLRVGVEYSPSIVLIGYMSENLARDVNVFRPFYSPAYESVIFTKPRFKLVNDELVLLKNPISTLADHKRFLQHEAAVLSEIGKNDYFYKTHYSKGRFDFLPSVRLVKILWAAVERKVNNPIFHDGMYNPQSEAYLVTRKIFDEFHKKVLENGALPIIVIFPDLNDHERSRAGKSLRYSVLLKYFQEKGYRYINLMDALKPYESKYSLNELTRQWGHYSPLGSQIIANYLSQQLHAWRFDDLSKVTEAIRAERVKNGSASR